MRRITFGIMSAAMSLTIAISNICSFVRDGRELDKLRNSVLRLHILANSDSERDQTLKLMVRDALLERSGEVFGEASDFDEAKENAAQKLSLIEDIAEEVLSENGCDLPAEAEITDMHFDERTYGDITMPAGEYTALRIEIGQAQGHNWWCVMYPPLCLPAACGYAKETEAETESEEVEADGEEEFFEDSQLDIIYHPQEYQVRFAIWDKIKGIFDF